MVSAVAMNCNRRNNLRAVRYHSPLRGKRRNFAPEPRP